MQNGHKAGNTDGRQATYSSQTGRTRPGLSTRKGIDLLHRLGRLDLGGAYCNWNHHVEKGRREYLTLPSPLGASALKA